jgi:hypothetical protein
MISPQKKRERHKIQFVLVLRCDRNKVINWMTEKPQNRIWIKLKPQIKWQNN